MKTTTISLILFLILVQACQQKNDSQNGSGSNDSTAVDSSAHRDLFAHNLPHAHHVNVLDSMLANAAEAYWDSLLGITHEVKHVATTKREPKWKTFGWHMYRTGSAYKSYPWELLWGVGYFSYEINPNTGGYKHIGPWRTTSMVDSAKKYGTKVFLSANLFGKSNTKKFLDNPEAIQTFQDSIMVLLKARDADGVCIDLEGVPGSSRTKLTSFLQTTSRRIKAEMPDAMVSIAVYAVDWSKAFQLSELVSDIDLFQIMAYDYYYSGSPQAGPVSPLESGDTWLPYNITNSVKYYLDKGVPKNQLMVALPYYGRSWHTEDSLVPSNTVKGATSHAPPVRTIERKYDLSKAGLDEDSDTQYLITKKDGYFEQLWFDDIPTLSKKYDFVKAQELAGICIWALGYDNGLTKYWALMEEKFGQNDGTP